MKTTEKGAIKGVEIKELAVHKDRRGLLMEFLRNDEQIFEKFGQAYMTLVKASVAKGWHYHKKQTDHFICVEGRALIALFDMRSNSPTRGESQKIIIAAPDLNGKHLLVKIPKGVCHGFCAYHCEQAKIVNIPTQHYNYQKPDEYRFPWNDPSIKFNWPKNIKFGG